MSHSVRVPVARESFSLTVHGVDLCAEQIAGGWRVQFGSKAAEDPFIDHAVARAMVISPGEAVEIVRRLFPREA